ncbi:Uncharacterised protein [Legionella jordanis]|nr:Uncharacterised protein [Legionella jordanis]
MFICVDIKVGYYIPIQNEWYSAISASVSRSCRSCNSYVRFVNA